MKKILLATTLLASTATVASAQETGVSISGYGRFGLEYIENRAAGTQQETQIATRLRLNIDATTVTDSGVVFGARMRLQSTDGAAAAGSAAKLFVAYEGFRVEVGNTESAFNSAGLIYNSEMGFQDSSFGDPQGAFFAYDATGGINPGVGIFASYSVGDFTGRISYISPDQQTLGPVSEEVAVSFDYASGPFAVGLGAYQDGAGIANNDGYYVGAAYTFTNGMTAGLNYIDEDATGGAIVTLYGNYTMGATTLRAYIADLDVGGADTAYGIGADYNLGGARLSGSIQSDYVGDIAADVGVRFDF